MCEERSSRLICLEKAFITRGASYNVMINKKCSFVPLHIATASIYLTVMLHKYSWLFQVKTFNLALHIPIFFIKFNYYLLFQPSNVHTFVNINTYVRGNKIHK